jgi:hypothetical protein
VSADRAWACAPGGIRLTRSQDSLSCPRFMRTGEESRVGIGGAMLNIAHRYPVCPARASQGREPAVISPRRLR